MRPTLYQLVKTISAAILISVCSYSSLNAAKVKPNKQYWQNRDMYFKGRVKSVQDLNFSYNPADSGALGHFFKEYLKFNKAGNLVERIDYQKDGKFSLRYIFRYDRAGNYVEKKSFAEDGSLRSLQTFDFDKEGNMIRTAKYNGADSLVEVHKHYYDEHGRMVELCREPETFHTNNTYSYDSLNRPVTRERIDVISGKRSGKLYIITHKYSYAYKYNGDTFEETMYTYNYKGYTTTILNKNDRVLGRRGIDGYEKPFEETFNFDPSGNVIEYKEVKEGMVDDKRSYRCEYVYDKKGNWIKRTTTSLDGKPRSSVERKIEYY
jgi:hypothetical protein